MKRSTEYILSTAVFLTSSIAYFGGDAINKQLTKPVTSEHVQTYNVLTSSLEQAKEPASNEFKKEYIQNMNQLQTQYPTIGQETIMFNKQKEKYSK